ncbi:MAG TPA: outer membrane beta-barrel protein [Gemmatimonadaceae bacterium]
MKNKSVLIGGLALGLAMPFANVEGQSTARSRAGGFYVGGGLDGSSIVVYGDEGVEETGGGAELTLGYGFSPHWSLYTQLSASSMTAAGGGNYSLAHFDFGTRVHFRAGPHTVVPFLQIAVTGRAVVDEVAGTQTTSSGGGISLGAGVNTHFTPAVAFSAGLMTTIGTFDTFKIDNRTLDGGTTIGASSTRFHLGLVWFPTG